MAIRKDSFNSTNPCFDYFVLSKRGHRQIISR